MEKLNSTANILRQQGNELYKNRQFFQALVKYNQSICFAEKSSENLGMAYANRSAVYFEMKLYNKCLYNIEQAIESYYPKENMHILEERSSKCMELMRNEKSKNNENIFKLSMSADKKLEFIADCLKINADAKYGRHIVTSKDLSVGDVIAIEKPFCSVLITESHFVSVPENNKYQRCNNCLKNNNLDLMPCQNCCHAMFCSKSCQEFAMKYYHQYECPIIHTILKSGSVNMSLRLFFISLSIFDGDIHKLKEFYLETQKSQVNVFDFDFSSDKNQILNKLKCLLSLSKSSKQFLLTQQINILSNHSMLSAMYEENKEFINNFIQHQSQISDHNFHGIFSSNLNTKSFDATHLKSLQEPIGSGSFLFASLINHSCAPNILRICVDAELYIIVCRRIEKGSQIFDCYKNNFMMESRESRQENLLKEFMFRCECQACLNDWPTFRQLKVKDMKLMKYAKKVNDELIDAFRNNSQLIKIFKNCKNILNENSHSYPSMELCVIQKTYATILLKFAAQFNFQF